jgi:hypothetical protein
MRVVGVYVILCNSKKRYDPEKKRKLELTRRENGTKKKKCEESKVRLED